MNEWIYLFLGLILAYLLEFTRPWLKSWWKKKNITARERKINIIQREYKFSQLFQKNPTILVAHVLFISSTGAFFLAVTLTLIGVIIFLSDAPIPLTPALSTTFGLVSTLSWFSFYKAFSECYNFFHYEEYKEKTIKKLEKLGTSLEEIEKEIESEEKPNE